MGEVPRTRAFTISRGREGANETFLGETGHFFTSQEGWLYPCLDWRVTPHFACSLGSHTSLLGKQACVSLELGLGRRTCEGLELVRYLKSPFYSPGGTGVCFW